MVFRNSKAWTSAALLCGLVAASHCAFADDKPSTPMVAATENKTELAVKTAWLSGLKEPQGLAHYGANEILLADYGAGKILKYSRDGKLLATLAEGLKSPSQIVVQSYRDQTAAQRLHQIILVSERKANRVISINADGKITPVGEAIEEPLGLARDGSTLFAVSHTTSKILKWDGQTWTPFFVPTEAGRYGYRCLAHDNGALLLSDEEGGEVLVLTQSGRLASWAKGIADPSGITIGPDGMAYVCDESEGGRLFRVNNLGEKTVVAEGLGRPRGVLFLDAKTALVSDRNGKVWKLTF